MQFYKRRLLEFHTNKLQESRRKISFGRVFESEANDGYAHYYNYFSRIV